MIIDKKGNVHLIDYGQSEWISKLEDFDKVMAPRWDFERIISVLKETLKLSDNLIGFFEGLVIIQF